MLSLYDMKIRNCKKNREKVSFILNCPTKTVEDKFIIIFVVLLLKKKKVIVFWQHWRRKKEKENTQLVYSFLPDQARM